MKIDIYFEDECYENLNAEEGLLTLLRYLHNNQEDGYETKVSFTHLDDRCGIFIDVITREWKTLFFYLYIHSVLLVICCKN